MDKKTQDAFYALVKAGLWADVNANLNANHTLFEGVDWRSYIVWLKNKVS